MSIFGKAANFMGKTKASGGFGFKDKAQAASKKMYGFGKSTGQAIKNNPGASLVYGGIGAGLTLPLLRDNSPEAVMNSIHQKEYKKAKDWVKSKPELIQAIKNEVGVMKVMEKGLDKDMRGKFPKATRLAMNPHRSNVATITKYIESNPKAMQFLLESLKPQFKEHIMSSVENHVDIIHKQATRGR